jgi:hypothetical protein
MFLKCKFLRMLLPVLPLALMGLSADYYDDVSTAILTGGIDEAQAPGVVGGEPKVHRFKVTVPAGTIAAGKTIQIGPALNPGEKVVLIALKNSAGGNSAALDIGDKASATRYEANANLSVVSAGRAAIVGIDYAVGQAIADPADAGYTEDQKILLTVRNSTLPAEMTIEGYIIVV